MLNRTDLDRIRNDMVIKDVATIREERMIANEQRASKMAVALARKTRMQAQDRERAATAPLEVKMKNYDED